MSPLYLGESCTSRLERTLHAACFRCSDVRIYGAKMRMYGDHKDGWTAREFRLRMVLRSKPGESDRVSYVPNAVRNIATADVAET